VFLGLHSSHRDTKVKKIFAVTQIRQLSNLLLVIEEPYYVLQATCITGWKTRDLSDIIIFVWTSHRFLMLITNF
jgi:hypothetical protein